MLFSLAGSTLRKSDCDELGFQLGSSFLWHNNGLAKLSFSSWMWNENGEYFMMNQHRRIVVFGIQKLRPIHERKVY